MKKILLLLLFPLTLFAQENVEFMDPNDLKKGMKGYALTVFQGLEPEKMDIEVIAYMKNRFPKAGMILVKVSGENVERTRVAAGMSGSPVYIDGKLVGALAYTWEFARDLMAGIVPIQDMISDKERGSTVNFVPQGAIPIKTAWSLEGLEGDDILKELQTLSDVPSVYKRGGVEKFVKAPSSRSNGQVPLKGGDGVAISLVNGDINLASIGTVTYVNGEDVYIYGHPMDSEGPISLPMARAEIYDIMSSLQLSFKLGTALPEIVGSTVFDGLSSVYGRFDIEAKMTPVTITFINKNKTNTYNFNIARSKKYMPLLFGRVIGRVLERELGTNIEKKIQMSWDLELPNTTISNQVEWGRYSIYSPMSIGGYWEQYLSILWNNTLEVLIPRKLNLTVQLKDEVFDYYAVNIAKPYQDEYFAGDTVVFQVSLNQYLTEKTTFTNLSLSLPNSIAEGTYTVLIGGALDLESELTTLFPDYYKIRTIRQLIDELKKPVNTHRLSVILVDTKNGSLIGNQFLTAMPLTRQSLFENVSSFTGKQVKAPSLIQTNVTMQHPVVGGFVQTINITKPAPLVSY